MMSVMHKPTATVLQGLIFDPWMNRMFTAERGKGAWLNGTTRLRVSDKAAKEPRQIIGFVDWPGASYNVLDVVSVLREQGMHCVNLLTIGYFEAMVAAGEFAATVFPSPVCLDTVPGHIIVEEAGGKVTNIFGEPQTYADGKMEGHIMSNGTIHDLIVSAVLRCD
jgi:myo-inositol-1(or 4)-monophosphatase